MALNPLREDARRASTAALGKSSPFLKDAESALAAFRAVRNGMERQVGDGDLTPKVARMQVAEAAQKLREELKERSAHYSPVPRTFLDRLLQVSEARKATRTGQSLESLQRETNRLLRQTLVEQQLANRANEFEGRTFVRPISGGQPAPTLDSLLTFHEQAGVAGDEPAREWARRQLEGMRTRLIDPGDLARIDTACERPDQVNPNVVRRYLEALRDAAPETLEGFVGQALDSRDANACCAAFVLAREEPQGVAVRWARHVLESLKDFPDAALEHLRVWEAEVRREDAEAAQVQAELVVARAEAEALMPGLVPPDPDALKRRAQITSRPVASPGEPIGLTLERRGFMRDEFEALHAAEQEKNSSEPVPRG